MIGITNGSNLEPFVLCSNTNGFASKTVCESASPIIESILMPGSTIIESIPMPSALIKRDVVSLTREQPESLPLPFPFPFRLVCSLLFVGFLWLA